MRFLAILSALMASAQALAACPAPADWAKTFYSNNYRFYVTNSGVDPNLLTPEFASLLKKEWAFAQGEIGHLDYDPWPGAQDGEIGKPLRFVAESTYPDMAVVAMSYPFVLEPKRPSPAHTVHLVLRKQPSQCWRMHDFITPIGESLSYVYSQQP